MRPVLEDLSPALLKYARPTLLASHLALEKRGLILLVAWKSNFRGKFIDPRICVAPVYTCSGQFFNSS